MLDILFISSKTSRAIVTDSQWSMTHLAIEETKPVIIY